LGFGIYPFLIPHSKNPALLFAEERDWVFSKRISRD